VVAPVALAETTCPLSSRNTPFPSWQHCGSLLQQRLPSSQGTTRGKMPKYSSGGR